MKKVFWMARFFIAYLFIKIANFIYPIKRIPLDFPKKNTQPQKTDILIQDYLKDQNPFYIDKTIIINNPPQIFRPMHHIMRGVH